MKRGWIDLSSLVMTFARFDHNEAFWKYFDLYRSQFPNALISDIFLDDTINLAGKFTVAEFNRINALISPPLRETFCETCVIPTVVHSNPTLYAHIKPKLSQQEITTEDLERAIRQGANLDYVKSLIESGQASYTPKLTRYAARLSRIDILNWAVDGGYEGLPWREPGGQVMKRWTLHRFVDFLLIPELSLDELGEVLALLKKCVKLNFSLDFENAMINTASHCSVALFQWLAERCGRASVNSLQSFLEDHPVVHPVILSWILSQGVKLPITDITGNGSVKYPKFLELLVTNGLRLDGRTKVLLLGGNVHLSNIEFVHSVSPYSKELLVRAMTNHGSSVNIEGIYWIMNRLDLDPEVRSDLLQQLRLPQKRREL